MAKPQPDPASPAQAYSLVSKDDKEPDSDVISLANSLGSEETTIQDLQNFEVDTDTLLSTLETLISIQNDAAHGTKRLQRATHGGDEVLDPSAEAAKQLFELSKELFKVIKSHVDPAGQLQLRLKATYQKDYDAAGRVPRESVDDEKFESRDNAHHVGGSVLKWSSDCMMAMLSLQADVEVLLSQDDKEERKRVNEARKLEDPGEDVDDVDDVQSISDAESWTESEMLDDVDEAEMVVTLHRHLGPLQSLTGRVRDILDLIECIIAKPTHLSPSTTTVTSGANFSYRNRSKSSTSPPLSPTKQTEPIAVYPKSASNDYASDYFLLRKELYELKDQLAQARNVVHMIRSLASDNDSARRHRAQRDKELYELEPLESFPTTGVVLATRCYVYNMALLETVEELLSNNGEDWLASEEKGKMGYETFQALDRDWVSSIRQRLASEHERLLSRGVKLTPYHVSEPLTEVLQEGLILFGIDADSLEHKITEHPPIHHEELGPEPQDFSKWVADTDLRRRQMMGERFLSTEEYIAIEEEREMKEALRRVELLEADNYLEQDEAEKIMAGGDMQESGRDDGDKDKGKGKEKVVDDGREVTLPARAYERPGPIDPERLVERLAVLGDW